MALVCHAPCALLNVKLPSGDPLIKGKNVTGFSDTEEAAVKLAKVVPFFEERPLVTAKQLDFEKFAGVLRFMGEGRHLTEDGLRTIARVTEQMNRRQRSRYLESSEAIRQPTQTDSELKIWS